MAYFIDEHTIEEIRDRADIVDVISKYVELKKTGANYRGLCPFHSERTPSFTVSPNKKIYKCFGCGQGGTVINFLMEIEGLSFPEACKQLADNYGITIHENKNFDDERQKKFDAMYAINREAAFFYMENLVKSRMATDYLNKRGINKQVARKFGLGYSPDSWDSMVNRLREKELDLDLAVDAGLIGRSEKGKYYDYYRNRIIFPIINNRSQVLGFGARALDNDGPKYLNTRDSLIFNKGRNLYGLNYIKRNEKVDRLILVEGYMDVISLDSQGIYGAVASLGTAFTADQAKLLRKYTDTLYISYDGDNAGFMAAKKAIEILHSIDWNASVIMLPKGLDPDEYLKTYGKFKYEVKMKEALDGYKFLTRLYESSLDMNLIEDKADLIRYIGSMIRKIKSPIERELQLQKLSKDYNISMDVLRMELFSNNNQDNVIANIDKKDKNISKLSQSDKSFIEILKIILNKDELYKDIIPKLDNKEIENKTLKEVYISIKDYIQNNEKIDKEAILSYLKSNYIINDYLYRELNRDILEFSEVNKEELIDDLLNNIKSADYKTERNRLLKRISVLENKENKTEAEYEEIKNLLEELMNSKFSKR